jgi:drug/metabolite transporter (DMT)-like permease
MNVHEARPAMRMSALVIACLLATWIVWGSTYLAIKYALVSFPPFFQMGSRFLVAGGLLVLWARFARKAPAPNRIEWRNALIIGTLMVGFGMGATAFAETSIGSGLVVAFIAITPMMITAINRLFGVRPSRRELLGVIVGFGGVVLLAQGAEFRASPLGAFMIALACFGWSFGSVLSQRRFPLASGAMGYASQMLCGGAGLMLASALRQESPVWPPTPLSALAWVYLVVFGSLVAFSAYMVLLSRVSVALASSYSFVNPIIGLLLGVAVGGETVTGQEWFASCIVLGGVALLLWRRRAPERDASSEEIGLATTSGPDVARR